MSVRTVSLCVLAIVLGSATAASAGKKKRAKTPAAASASEAPSEQPAPSPEPSAETSATAEPAQAPAAAVTTGAKPAATPTPPAAAPAAPTSEPIAAPIVVQIFGFGAGRSFYYSAKLHGDASSDRVPGYYDLPIAPGAGAKLEWYPLAHGRHHRAIEPGLTGTYRREALATKTEYPNSDVQVQAWEWQGGLRLRVPVGPHELGLDADFGMHAFEPGAPTTAAYLAVPGVDWTFVRVGADARFELPSFFVETAAAYRIVINETGGLVSNEWYSSLRAAGFDLSLELGVPLSRALDLSAGVEVRRYVFSGPIPKRDTHGSNALFGGVDLHTAGVGKLTLKIGG